MFGGFGGGNGGDGLMPLRFKGHFGRSNFSVGGKSFSAGDQGWGAPVPGGARDVRATKSLKVTRERWKR